MYLCVEAIKNDKKMVLTAVRNNGVALGAAPLTFRDDKKIALEAIKSNGWAFMHVSENLKNDKHVRFAASQSDATKSSSGHFDDGMKI